MSKPRSRRRWSGRLWLAALACMALGLSLAMATTAMAALPITNFEGYAWDQAGAPDDQAGGHPFEAATEFSFPLEPNGSSPLDDAPAEDMKTSVVTLPPGFVGNPQAVPQCELGRVPTPGSALNGCPANSQVGMATVYTSGLPVGMPITASVPSPIYNMEPPPGVIARFAFRVLFPDVTIDAVLRPDDYTIQVRVENASQSLAVRRVKVALWGVPASPAHDEERLGGGCDDVFVGTPCSAGIPERAFLTNPSDCSAGPLTTTLDLDTWQDQGTFTTASFDHDPNGAPIAVANCDRVSFEPELSALPTTEEADSPSGLAVELDVPQFGITQPSGVASAHLKRAVVTLPPGMTANPAVATGLAGCGPDQIDLDGPAQPTCPRGSKIGTVEVETPLLAKSLPGSIYLAEQGDNPFGSLLALYLVLHSEERGVLVKLPGRIDPDPVTGQLRATFDDNPQLPFSHMSLRFKGGEHAPLVTPASCGTHRVVAQFTPWSASDPEAPTPDEVVTSTSSFEITTGPDGSPCVASETARGFDPGLSAGMVDPTAGAYSPFVLRLTRPDGQQDLKSVSVTLPEGLSGKLQGVPYCPEPALAGLAAGGGTPSAPGRAAPNTATGTAAGEVASAACPAPSQVGGVTIGAGAGASPFYLRPFGAGADASGRAYLAGPYRGAPLSLAIITPALAGPFDLGNVMVRSAIHVDERTARLTVVSDEIPTILEGIPLKIRDLRVNMDRPEFTLNPTDCREQQVAAHVTATHGRSADLSERFQVGDCAALGFKPRFRAKILNKGRKSTRRSFNPRMRFVVRGRDGDANIGRAAVTLPPQVILDQSHIRTTCTRDQFADRTCPEGSIYGHAKAWSTVLKRPLEGPVYLKSNGGARELPDLVADLDGEVRIALEGWIDTAKGGRIRNIFPAVPDAPVSRFVLTMRGGKRGLLVNSKDLCRDRRRGVANFRGQNGKRSVTRPPIQTAYRGCKKIRGKAAR